MIKLNTDRLSEINAAMKKLNDDFVLDQAVTDFEYLQTYQNAMSVLSKELLVLMAEYEAEMMCYQKEMTARNE